VCDTKKFSVYGVSEIVDSLTPQAEICFQNQLRMYTNGALFGLTDEEFRAWRRCPARLFDPQALIYIHVRFVRAEEAS
jgi:nanoRNase/pAp phosphatase (c-di-AMP/oligoRNAs hydrolase)